MRHIDFSLNVCVRFFYEQSLWWLGLPSVGPVMPQPYRRWSGTIKWFSNERSYGFIRPINGGEDIFVHYSSVKSDGYIRLRTGTLVEFDVVGGHWREKRLKAINVTGPGGTLLQDSRRRAINIATGSGSGSTGSNAETRPCLGPCYRCGEMGHIAKYCFLGRKNDIAAAWPGFGQKTWIGVAWCHFCGQLGHLASNCLTVSPRK